MFSSRVTGELKPNRLTNEILRARAAGRQLLDLTVTNPTAAGIRYPASILAPLSDRAAERYAPNPLGLPAAREAISRDYARRGIPVTPERIVLTASTSEAYSILFKLLCDPAGDCVMVPVPSYPLFDHLTALDGVAAIPYVLEYYGRWAINFDLVDARWTVNVRAVLAVTPNNPTGSTLTAAEMAGLSARCAARDAALIVDEVFGDYALAPAFVEPHAPAAALTFRLGGLSKSVGLPQVKLGWMVVEGPEALALAALERLEVICDTYLSVSTPVQVAAPRLLTEGAAVRERILARIRANHDTLRAVAALHPSVELLRCDAGWSAVLRVPATRSEESLVLELLERDAVLVHPGFFFDFPREAFVVLSLLPEPEMFSEGVRRVVERAHA